MDMTQSPASWHRTPCFVHDRLVVTGDLPTDENAARALLDEWVRLGVTHIVDVRGEWSDASFVARRAPHVAYVWAPTHDNGGRQRGRWFDEVLDALGDAVHDEHSVILVHCHMAVNRGPSMALRVLLEQGHDPLTALRAIRKARPIAAVAYAEDAVNHFHTTVGSSDTLRCSERRRVRRWLERNAIDTGWIISRIRRAE
jgi:hypothetical protein